MKRVVYTDLDGTLLDLETYSFSKALDTLEQIKDAGVPLVFCSSKTRNEQEYYQKAMGLNEPFIVENGSAIFIPKGYFSIEIPFNTYQTSTYDVICLGENVNKVRSLLAQHRANGSSEFKFYADLAVADVSSITGLGEDAARRAMQRDFSETILTGPMDSQFNQELLENGFRSIPGSKFETVVGANADKGRAVEILNSLFIAEFGPIETIGIGDSRNDEEMLRVVDKAFLVQKAHGKWDARINTKLNRVAAVGPDGWNEVIKSNL